MSSVRMQEHSMTLDEFLAWEERQEGRHEFVDGVIRAMSGASYDHNQIVLNLSRETSNRLMGKPCRSFPSAQKVRAEASDTTLYPDVGIHCGKPKLGAGNALLNVVAVFEVQSPSTYRYDRTDKFQHYQQIETLQEYFLVYQDTARIEAFRRTEEGDWDVATYTVYVGLGATLMVESAEIAIPLSGIYYGLDFTEQEAVIKEEE